jgi:uncharacterized metal-binding protein
MNLNPVKLVFIIVGTMCGVYVFYSLDCGVYIWLFPQGGPDARCGPALRADLLNDLKTVLEMVFAFLAGANVKKD